MDPLDPQPQLPRHIRAASRPSTESQRLLEDLVGRCWPGGIPDRLEPCARGWLCLWGPQRTVVDLPICDCLLGRCPSCN